MAHPDANNPADWSELVITGVCLPSIESGKPQTSSELPTNLLPGAVWLAPDACLIRSHLDQPEDAPQVINVVGTSNCEELAGWVLLLG